MQPGYRARAPIPWRVLADGTVELRDERGDRWLHLNTWTARILAQIDRGAPFEELLAAMPGDAARADAKLRRFLFNLSQLGHVDIEFPHAARFGQWVVEKELGRGGVGIAYLCRGPDGARAVVKRAWDFVQPYAVTEKAVRNEGDVLRALDHPGIVRLVERFEIDGHEHLARGYVDGQSIERHVGRGVPRAARIEIISGVARILSHLHELGYLMIDLRPANFFETAEGPVLVDVGSCRAMTDGEAHFERVAGSPGFISPEMRAARRTTPRSDLWGLGRLYTFLATGQPPPPQGPLPEKIGGLDADEQGFVDRLCAESPEARPANALAAEKLALNLG